MRISDWISDVCSSDRMSEIVRALVPLDSHSTEAFQTAFGYANAICEKTGATDIIVLTHTKQQLDHTSLSRLLGVGTVRALAKGSVTLGSGVRLHAETMRTLGWPPRNSVLVVYYAETGIPDQIGRASGGDSVCRPWRSRWSPYHKTN